MSAWNTYQSRMKASGADKRSAVLLREQRFLQRKLPSSPSYKHLFLNGEPRNVAVIDSDNLNQKTLFALPGEDLPHGGYVEWKDNHWLIVEKDANNDVCTKAIMKQCNYLLKWISNEGNVVERWCIVEDGTKYLTGEWGDNNFILTRGDSRISVTIAKDAFTLQFNRDSRFLIDDYNSPSVLAYRLTKPFKLGGSFNEPGVMYLVMQECNTEDTDNFDLHIANYYKYFPKDGSQTKGPYPGEMNEEAVDKNGKKVWL